MAATTTLTVYGITADDLTDEQALELSSHTHRFIQEHLEQDVDAVEVDAA